MSGFVRALGEYGALPSQVVDLEEESERTLPYVDLIRTPAAGRAPAVVEIHGNPRAYIFDGSSPSANSGVVASWIRRIAFRGDAEWVGVLRPGRLDIYHAALDGEQVPIAVGGIAQGPGLFAALDLMRPERPAPNVRRALLKLLRESIDQAKALGASGNNALSLVGRAIFWRFLIDRGLLDQLDPAIASPGATTWAACLSNKRRALESFSWLEETFNGGFLPFEGDRRTLPADVFTIAVGNIAHGATSSGQLSLALPTDWRELNFAEIPVGLLSEVYEAFAHSEDANRAHAESVYYTPRSIAELVVGEALNAVSDVAEPRLLDPAAGAGVFLVAAFRALVAREWARSRKRPSRAIVRRILNRQLVGFDINDSALRLAELALYLTAIELDPERRPRPLKLLKFDVLRGAVLFEKAGGAAAGSLLPVEESFRGRFDAVVGNPPWTAAKAGSQKANWIAASRDVVRSRLGDARAEMFGFPDKNPDLPFVFRAMDWAKPGGCIALIVHARWLFAQTTIAQRARRDLFECVHVTGILNGTALRDTAVWPNVRHAFCALFARNELPPENAAFLFVSPELDHAPDRTQTRFRIDWRDAEEIAVGYVLENGWALKARFRATPFDEQVLKCMQQRGIALGAYLETVGSSLRNGYQSGGQAGTQQSASALMGMRDLRGTNPGYFVDPKELPKFTRPTLLRPRDPDIYRAPLVLVSESMTVGERPRASVSFSNVLYDERYDGASLAGVEQGEEIARYLQLAFVSSLAHHALFLLDGQYGIEREVVHRESLAALPVRPWNQLSTKMQSTALNLSRRLEEGMVGELGTAIDDFVFDVFELSRVQRDAVLETLRTAIPTAAAKRESTRLTTARERKIFADVVATSLSSVLEASGKRAFVRMRDDETIGPWRMLQVDVCTSSTSVSPPLEAMPPQLLVEAADGAAASLVVIQVNRATRFVAILDAYRHWTRTRARMLAVSLVGGE